MPSYSFKNQDTFLSRNLRALDSWNLYALNFPYSTQSPRIAIDPNGNVYTIMQSSDFFQSGSYQQGAIILIKTNKYGVTEWKKRFTRAKNYNYTEISGITYDSFSDSIILCGKSYETADNTSLLSKINSSGDIVWSKIYISSNGSTQRGRLVSVVTDSSGNIYTASYHGYNTTANTGQTVMKFNSSGTLQWIRYKSDYSSASEQNISLKIDNNGDVIAIGYSYDGNGSSSSILTKWNTSGTLQFTKKLLLAGSYKQTTGYEIVVDSSNNYYTAGSFYDTQTDVYVVKYNSSGIVQWQKTVRGGGDADGRSICLDSSGNVYIAFTQSDYIYIVKLDSSGNTSWARRMYVAGLGPSLQHSNNTQNMQVFNNILYIPMNTSGGVGPNVSGVFLFRLPIDGSKTGTIDINGYKFIYETTSVTVTNRSATQSDANNTVLSALTFTTNDSFAVIANSTNAEAVSSPF